MAKNSAQTPPTETEPTVTEPTTTPTTTRPTVMGLAIGSTDYRVNDQVLTMDTPAVIKEGRTLLPVSYIATPLGASEDWRSEEKKVVIHLNGKTIELRAGQNTAMFNGVEDLIDPDSLNVTPEVVPPGRIVLPMRFVAENLGCRVDWDPERQTVTVTCSKP